LDKGAKLHGEELPLAALAGNHEQSVALSAALLEAGADVNARHEYGFTALYLASLKGNKDLVKLLLAQPGIKLDATNQDEGATALMAAAEAGQAEIVEMLLAAGAKAGVTDISGETAIAHAQRTLEKQQAIIAKLKTAAK
jgi:ankyrin repeat protein